jgi:predicted PurR-regulated permease PerM
MVRSETLRVGFFAVALAVFGYLVVLVLRPFLTALLAAVLLAVLLSPLQRRLAPRIGPRVAAFGLLTLAVVVATGVAATLALAVPAGLTDVSEMVADLPGRAAVEGRLETMLGISVPLESVVESAPRRVGELLLGDLTSLLGTATDLFLAVVLFLFVLYYLLVDGDDLIDWIEARLPLTPETTDKLHDEAHQTTWAVLKGHLFVAVVQGAVAGLGLFLVGIPNALFWSLVMMVFELFPVVGVAGVLGPAVGFLAIEERFLAAAFLTVYGLSAVAFVDDYLRAHVVDRESSLHSATILVGVFGGVYAFGVMGLFYGPIVVGLFTRLVEIFDEEYVEAG